MIENRSVRCVIIAFAIILGLGLTIYAGGVLGQLFDVYQVWQAQDGILGGVPMRPISFLPAACFQYALTPSGFAAILLILATAGGLLAYLKLQNRFGSKDHDDRNFTRSKKGTYGTAGWMANKEMRRILDLGKPEDAHGTILGMKDGSVISLPEETKLNQHIFVCGASGTMKSRAIIRNHLFQSIKRGDSVIVTDPKAELYADTAELFRQNGYHVRVFNLVEPVHGDSWNCMADLDGDTLMAQVLTDVIIANTSNDKSDHFWDNGEANLLKALVLYIDQDSTRGPEAKHLPAVYQMLTRYGERQLTAMFDRLPLAHPARAPYNLFQQSSETVRSGIILGLGTRLQVMQNDAVCDITSRSDIDLTEPGRSKCAYFVILSDQDSALDFLSSLFFSFLFLKLVRYADAQPNGQCNIPVNIVLDEFNNIGTIPDFARKLSTIRSRALRVCMAVQGIGQLQNRYPHNLWAELVGNCDTQVMLGCTDEVSAEYFSARSGDMTVEVNSYMTNRQSIAIAQMIPQYRYTEGLGRRRLLTPDEILRLPNDELLIILRGQKILKAKKFDFTGHPYVKHLVPAHISTYTPHPHPEIPIPQTDLESPPPRSTRVGGKLLSSARPPDEF